MKTFFLLLPFFHEKEKRKSTLVPFFDESPPFREKIFSENEKNSAKKMVPGTAKKFSRNITLMNGV